MKSTRPLPETAGVLFISGTSSGGGGGGGGGEPMRPSRPLCRCMFVRGSNRVLAGTAMPPQAQRATAAGGQGGPTPAAGGISMRNHGQTTDVRFVEPALRTPPPWRCFANPRFRGEGGRPRRVFLDGSCALRVTATAARNRPPGGGAGNDGLTGDSGRHSISSRAAGSSWT